MGMDGVLAIPPLDHGVSQQGKPMLKTRSPQDLGGLVHLEELVLGPWQQEVWGQGHSDGRVQTEGLGRAWVYQRGRLTSGIEMIRVLAKGGSEGSQKRVSCILKRSSRFHLRAFAHALPGMLLLLNLHGFFLGLKIQGLSKRCIILEALLDFLSPSIKSPLPLTIHRASPSVLLGVAHHNP